MGGPGLPLTLSQVRKTYRMGQHVIPALQGVDLQVRQGQLLALTGPSGSGKSTLLNICGLIDAPDAGQVLFQGEHVDVNDVIAATLRRRDGIGFVFQNFNLVPVMNVFENVEYPLFVAGVPSGERRARVLTILEEVGLGEHARHRPDALSGGQRQRVAIARALVKQPALVIADEPTASLDTVTAGQMLDLMRASAHKHGAAFLIASHDERLTRRADRVIALRDGVIVPSDEERPCLA
ncbi:ABC transporter ATP-binding protein [Duganella sp. FT3S]|uniref:ABC transporter ATP-binding protein n=1 Tax=Rugamonas fusca TaxID=2758568 RepID=A0A7W2EII9_9BURK|nr:ABC transporter ATP-binding protein [Rugamonas fusca]MBA5606571.1 ABC transporter ATP-binding protein [Rugamonas fusca]